MKISTKTGDNATTSLMFGRRVSKASQRVGAYGAIDELSAWIGCARAQADEELAEELLAIQKKLVPLMTELATANEDFPKLSEKKVRLLEESDLAEVEKKIEEFENNQNTFSGWKYAGQTRLDAALNMARVQCRKAEREMAALNETEKLPRPLPLKYINRLSDLLYLYSNNA